MKIALIAGLVTLSVAGAAHAGSYGKPCTTQPREKWMSIQQLEKIVNDHGYKVAKSKIKGACFEVYARDPQGQRIELFLDPVTGNPADADWSNPAKQAG